MSFSFWGRIAQALRNALISPYLVIDTDVRPRFSRPAFQVTSYTSLRKIWPSLPLYFLIARRTPTTPLRFRGLLPTIIQSVLGLPNSCSNLLRHSTACSSAFSLPPCF